MNLILLASVIAVAGAGGEAQPPVGPHKGRVPTQTIGCVGHENATRVLNVLGRAGIPATADGPFLVYEVKVPPRHAKQATDLLRTAAAQESYWLQLNDDPSGKQKPPSALAQEKVLEKELAALQGNWVIVGKQFMGKTATDEEVKPFKEGRTLIKGNKITVISDELGKEEVRSEGTFKLDPSAKPKSMDLYYTWDSLRVTKGLAIYELEGDALRVCYSVGAGAKRPTEFAGRLDGESLLLTYKRQK